MDKMLVLDPDKRVSASMALELPMFADFREPEEETEALPYDHSMDNADLPLEQWKRKSREGGWGGGGHGKVTCLRITRNE